MRAFLAAELDAAGREHLAVCQRRLRDQVDAHRRIRVNWTAPDAMHLTVKFLGEIDSGAAEALRGTLAPTLRALKSFTIPLTHIGAFPSPQDARVLWVGPPRSWHVTEDSRRLHAAHGATEDACASIGIARDDKPFSPHLTIARVREGGREVGRALTGAGAFDSLVDGPPLAVHALVLFKSVLGTGSPVHTPLWTADFSA
jgi:2'-5' RNA ligase